MNDSAYIIQLQIGDSEEVIRIFAKDKTEMIRVLSRSALKDEYIVLNVQGLGPVDTASDFISNCDDDTTMEFGQEN